MPKIISERKRVHVECYSLFFEMTNLDGSVIEKGWGYGFPCNKDGVVNPDALNPDAKENYLKCMSGAHHVAEGKFRNDSHSYTEDAILQCDCGEEIYLSGFTNTCDKCEADYDRSGNRLANRSQWGYETGESLADILRIQ